MDTEEKSTPVNVEEFGEFIKSIGVSDHMFTRLINIVKRRPRTDEPITEEMILGIDFDDLHLFRTHHSPIYGISTKTLLKYFEPYQKILKERYERISIEKACEMIKTELNGDLEVFEHMDAFKVLLDIHYSRFVNKILPQVPEYTSLRTYTFYERESTRERFKIILNKYRDHLLYFIDELSKYYKEDLK